MKTFTFKCIDAEKLAIISGGGRADYNFGYGLGRGTRKFFNGIGRWAKKTF